MACGEVMCVCMCMCTSGPWRYRYQRYCKEHNVKNKEETDKRNGLLEEFPFMTLKVSKERLLNKTRTVFLPIGTGLQFVTSLGRFLLEENLGTSLSASQRN